jgi:hypothetical protein
LCWQCCIRKQMIELVILSCLHSRVCSRNLLG